MANVNLKTKYKNDKKVSVSVSRGTIIPGELSTDDGVATAGTLAIADVVTLNKLPANSVVTNAFVVVKTAPTTGTQTMKITVGTTDVIAAVAVGTVTGAIKGGTVTRVHTGTGANVTVTTGVAALVDGEFEVVVEYIEYDKVTGELTN